MYRDHLNSNNSVSEIYSQARAIETGESPYRPEYESYLRQYPGRGALKVSLSIARGAYPVCNAMVDVAQVYNGVRYSLYNDVTDISGIVDNMTLPAKSLATGLNDDTGVLPEAEYIVTVFHPDYREITDCKVVIHDRVETILPLSLTPITGREDG